MKTTYSALSTTFESPASSTITHLAIVAGGRGGRLSSIIGDLPKVLVPIGGKPVLEHQLDLAAQYGIEEVTIFAGYLAEKIHDFVGDGSRFRPRIRILTEKEPMGNAGALLQFLDLLPEHFFVAYGDLMLAVDLQHMGRRHLEKGADLTIMVHPNDHPYDSDLVESDTDDWVTAIHACPHPQGRFFGNLVNAALYVARRDALRSWAGLTGKQDFTNTILPGLIRKGCVLAYRSIEYAQDMGTPSRLQSVEADWQAGRISPGSNSFMPAIFLDRDGTLNSEKGHLKRPEDLELFPGAASALRRLRQAGFRIVVLTNQPVIARGEATEAEVAAIHRKLEWELGKEGAYLDGIYICPHHPDGGFPGERPELKKQCECRKPGTKMFEQACNELRIDAANSWMIGDRIGDIEMACRAGLRSILVRTGEGGRHQQFSSNPDHIASDLLAAADVILKSRELRSQ